MTDTQVRGTTTANIPGARRVDMKLEVVVIPVSDVDRAKQFYGGLGWRLDADFTGRRFPGRPVHASGLAGLDHLRHGHHPAAPGSQGAVLVVSDIEAARAELSPRRRVSEVFHCAGVRGSRVSGRGSGAAQLRLVRLVQGSGRQRLADAGGHHAPARPRRRRDTTFAPERSRGRAAACGGGPWRAREAQRRPARRELAGLVRRVHRQRAVR